MRKIIFILGIIYSGFVSSQDFNFEHFSSIQGLSNNIVRDITQSSDGYMWFTTSGGLNRFDGQNFEVYRPESGDDQSLSYSRLYRVFEDNHGFIWVISSIGNLHRVNPGTHEVDNFWENGIIPDGAYVRSFHKTEEGSIWLITDRGLACIVYPNADSDEFIVKWIDTSDGLLSDRINFLHEDQSGRIWLGTEAGLQRLDNYNADSDVPQLKTFYADPATAFTTFLEMEQHLFFGTGEKQLLVFEENNDRFYEQEEISKNLRAGITTMAAGKDGTILLGTTNGDIAWYRPNDETFRYFEHSKTAALDSSYVIQILPDNYGKFWMVTENRGVYKFDSGTQKFSYFNLNAENRSFLGESDKQVLFEDSNKDLWIGINGGGLFLYDREKDLFRSFMNDPENSNSISSNIILSLYEDRSKNLWIGTSNGGINKISLQPDYLRKIKPVENPQNSFENYIRAVASDGLGNVWVGSKAGKIYAYNQNKKILTLPDDLWDSRVLPIINIYSLYFDYNNNLWIGTKGEGIYVIRDLLSSLNDLKSKKLDIVHFSADPNNSNSLSTNNAYSIIQDVYGQYWVASFQGGIDLLTDPFGSPVFSNFNSNAGEAAIASDETRHLFFDNRQNLWIATSNGVSILENKYLTSSDKQFVSLKPNIGKESDLAGKVVYQISQTLNNQIVLALLDGGVDLLVSADFESGHFEWKHFSQSMQTPTVYSIESDFQGNVWLGAENGLRKLLPENENIERYNFSSHKSRLNFTESAARKTTRNELVFGTADGFILFNPELISKDTSQYPLVFSGLEVNGERMDEIIGLSTAANGIKLSYNQDNVTVYFATLDYTDQDAIQYSFFLDGYDTYWSNPSSQNMATYRKLPPGDYVLRVKSTNSSGFWLEDEAMLNIEIAPPFWKSGAGYAILFVILLIIVIVVTILIRHQVAIRNENRIEKALNERRIQYYTNISNDFKTPLSLILNPAEEILQSHKSSSFAKDNALIIKKNAIYLKRLIEQILEFRKIREGKMQLRVKEVNITEFFREVYLAFLPLAKRMEVNFEYDCNLEVFNGYADLRILEKITYNLLSNAFRFTPSGRAIQLLVEINNRQNTLTIQVKDEGAGINEADLPKIFDRFYESSSSSGIGLFFTREMVLLHKGEIKAQNNPKRGATFVASIPVSAESYESSEIVQTKAPQMAFDLSPINEIETLVANQRPTLETPLRPKLDYLSKVLVVSSDNNLRSYLSSELSREFNVIGANNGKQGMDLTSELQPDLILCDVNTSDINGFELTKLVKQNFNTNYIPVILLSNEESEETWISSAECGADELIIKPFNLKYLITKVNANIQKWKKLKERFERDAIPAEVKIEKSSNDAPMLDKVQALIDQNMADPKLNVEFIAARIGVSRTLFYKKMKSQSGYAPNEYLTLVRMKEAARLLSTTNKTIGEISNKVGFADANYFCKTFKKHYGKPPSDYKKVKVGKGII